MALASNQKEQLAKRVKQEIEKLAPELTVSSVQAGSDGQPELTVKSNGTVIALLAVRRRTYKGFNIVAEISESAAEGLPEHELWLAVDDSNTLVQNAKLLKASFALGCSGLKLIVTTAAPVEADLVEANVSAELPNDARNGFVGQ